MGVLKNLTKEYFGDIERKEDEIVGVYRVSFTDGNGKFHKNGFQPKNKEELVELLEKIVEKRGWDGDFNDIDTSLIEDMSSLFYKHEYFNGDISGWNMSNVISMNHMFFGATSFNQPIGNWEFPKVTDMSNMFYRATSFNQPIGNWEFPKVTDMRFMFKEASSFNKDLSLWKINERCSTINMFDDCPIKKGI